MQTFGQELKNFSATNDEMRRKSKTSSKREMKQTLWDNLSYRYECTVREGIERGGNCVRLG